MGLAPCHCSVLNPPPQPTSISKFLSNQPYLSILDTQCTTMKDLKQIHANFIKTGLVKHPIVTSRLLAFCSASPYADMNYAYLIFSQIDNPNLLTWNTIIRGFSNSSTPQLAISLFIHMLVYSPIQPQRLTYPSVFRAYAHLGRAHDGSQLHGRVVKLGLQFDSYIRNTLIFMYANCGFLVEAQKLFDRSVEFDVVAWNSMIMGFAKIREIDASRSLFDKMPKRSHVSWNSMISGYVRNGRLIDALQLFKEMLEGKIEPSEFTLVSLLNASAGLGALNQGEWIHEYIRKNKIELNVIVVTAIIDMYCKCGCIEKAIEFFERTPCKGLSCWNSMILGLGTNGFEDQAIQLFGELEFSASKPDGVSFIGILTACNHAGLVDEAKYYFSLMIKKYNIEPSIEHYGCMVDVLCRAGLLEDAEDLIESMPIEPDITIWASLLSSCKKNGNVEMGKRAARHLKILDPSESCGYVLLSSLYAASGEFENAIEERLVMKEMLLLKEPGCSWIEVNGEIHEFVCGGGLHSHAKHRDTH
ncbi:Pentatricopeptide repeat [Dillenia turbinata]|uniref:Pentatricopeptide repeat n=1 Tax=Dillenia turbinata TaxID=194707 RepID=A0AAN8UYC1_9MAGN